MAESAVAEPRFRPTFTPPPGAEDYPENEAQTPGPPRYVYDLKNHPDFVELPLEQKLQQITKLAQRDGAFMAMDEKGRREIIHELLQAQEEPQAAQPPGPPAGTPAEAQGGLAPAMPSAPEESGAPAAGVTLHLQPTAGAGAQAEMPTEATAPPIPQGISPEQVPPEAPVAAPRSSLVNTLLQSVRLGPREASAGEMPPFKPNVPAQAPAAPMPPFNPNASIQAPSAPMPPFNPNAQVQAPGAASFPVEPTAGVQPLGAPTTLRQRMLEALPSAALPVVVGATRAVDTTASFAPELAWQAFNMGLNAQERFLPSGTSLLTPDERQSIDTIGKVISHPIESLVAGGQGFPRMTDEQEAVANALKLTGMLYMFPKVWGKLIPLFATNAPWPDALKQAAGAGISGAALRYLVTSRNPVTGKEDSPWFGALAELGGMIGWDAAAGVVRWVNRVAHGATAVEGLQSERRAIEQITGRSVGEQAAEMRGLQQKVPGIDFSMPELLQWRRLMKAQQELETIEMQGKDGLKGLLQYFKREMRRWNLQQALTRHFAAPEDAATRAFEPLGKTLLEKRAAVSAAEAQHATEEAQLAGLVAYHQQRLDGMVAQYKTGQATLAELRNAAQQQADQELHILRTVAGNLTAEQQVVLGDEVVRNMYRTMESIFRTETNQRFTSLHNSDLVKADPQEFLDIFQEITNRFTAESKPAKPQAVRDVETMLRQNQPPAQPQAAAPTFGRLSLANQPPPPAAAPTAPPVGMSELMHANSRLLKGLREATDSTERYVLRQYHEQFFDTMEQAVRATGDPQLFTDWRSARDFYFRNINTFMDGPGALFLEEKAGGPLAGFVLQPASPATQARYPGRAYEPIPDLTNGQVLPLILQGSAGGALSAGAAKQQALFKQFWASAKNDPQVILASRDVLAQDFYQAATTEAGTLDPLKAKLWLRKHQAMFDEAPPLGSDFVDMRQQVDTIRRQNIMAKRLNQELRDGTDMLGQQRALEAAKTTQATEVETSKTALDALREETQALEDTWKSHFSDTENANAALRHAAGSRALGEDVDSVVAGIVGSDRSMPKRIRALDELIRNAGIQEDLEAKKGLLQSLWNNTIGKSSTVEAVGVPGKPPLFDPDNIEKFLSSTQGYGQFIAGHFGQQFLDDLQLITRGIKVVAHQIEHAHGSAVVPQALRQSTAEETWGQAAVLASLFGVLLPGTPRGVLGIFGLAKAGFRFANTRRLAMLHEAFYSPEFAGFFADSIRGKVLPPRGEVLLRNALIRAGLLGHDLHLMTED